MLALTPVMLQVRPVVFRQLMVKFSQYIGSVRIVIALKNQAVRPSRHKLQFISPDCLRIGALLCIYPEWLWDRSLQVFIASFA